LSAFSQTTRSDSRTPPDAGGSTTSQPALHRFAIALHRFAILVAAVTLIPIFAGGLVTSTGSAMAVPSWPLDAGHLIPQQWGAGVLIEWGHRAIAGTVSILTLTLTLWVWMAERRAWVRYTALAALGLVLVQAVLGGITVLFNLPLALAVAHAMTAQAFFCVMVALAMFTNPRWEMMTPLARDSGQPSLTPLAVATTAIIYMQIFIGALMRHMHAGLAIPDFPLAFGHLVPPMFSVPIAVNFAHRCGAVVVSIFVLWTVARVYTSYRDRPALTHPASLLLALLLMQISLGAMTIWSGRAVLPTTAHVVIGAAVLATSLALTIRIRALRGLASVAEAARVRSPISPTMERKVSA
jgi:heme a synthase